MISESFFQIKQSSYECECVFLYLFTYHSPPIINQLVLYYIYQHQVCHPSPVHYSYPTSPSRLATLFSRSTHACCSFIFSYCSWFCCYFKKFISLTSSYWSFLKSFSRLATSSSISLRISLVFSVAWCSKVAHSDRNNCASFLFSFKFLLKSFTAYYKKVILLQLYK